MLLTEKEVDVAFEKVFVGIARFLTALHEGVQARFPGEIHAQYAVNAMKDLEVVTAKFTQDLKVMRSEISEAEVGVRAKRAELQVASADLKGAQEKLVAMHRELDSLKRQLQGVKERA